MLPLNEIDDLRARQGQPISLLAAGAVSVLICVIIVLVTSVAAHAEPYSWIGPEGATAAVPAERETTETTRPFTPIDAVNLATYTYLDMAPVEFAFRMVAADRGWAQTSIDNWTPFVLNIVAGESGGCWNVRRGAKILEPVGCVIRQGGHTDAGFGQVTPVLYGITCPHGLCSPGDIVASPWSSMLAMVLVIEAQGSAPWIFKGPNGWMHLDARALVPGGLPVRVVG